MDLFQQFFGDQSRQQDYDEFLQRAERNPESISDEEAARRYREMMRNAPPELADEANEAVFSHLPPAMRSQMAQSFQEAHRNPQSAFQGYDYDDVEQAADPRNLSKMARRANELSPDLLGQIAGSPIGRAAMAAGAAYLANRVLGGRGGAMGGFGGGASSGLGGLLGSLLGGAVGGNSTGSRNRRYDGTL